jgi:tetrahydromethanopterin S-methyltransferase subunit B
MPDSPQNEILRQLAEIQRTLGECVGTVRALEEDLQSHVEITASYRDRITASVDNVTERIAHLEQASQIMSQTVEKTLKPLASKAHNFRERVIGFTMAWSIVVAAVSFFAWLVTTGWDNIVKLIARLPGAS